MSTDPVAEEAATATTLDVVPNTLENRIKWNYTQICVDLNEKMNAIREMDKYILKRASVYQDYIKAMEAVQKKAPRNFDLCEETSVYELWSSLIEEEEKLIKVTFSFVDEYQNRLHEIFVNINKETEAAKNLIEAEGYPIYKQSKEAVKAKIKARDKYYKLSSMHEKDAPPRTLSPQNSPTVQFSAPNMPLSSSSMEAIKSASVSETPPTKSLSSTLTESKRNKDKSTKIGDELIEEANSYKRAVEYANEVQDIYDREMGHVVEEYKKIIAKRKASIVEAYTMHMLSLQQKKMAIESVIERIKNAIENYTEMSDFEEVVQRLEVPHPQRHVFEPYTGELPADESTHKKVKFSKAHFGVNLNALVKRERKQAALASGSVVTTGSTPGADVRVPSVLRFLTNVIVSNGGTLYKGIFRVSCNVQVVQKFKDVANSSGEFHNLKDPNDAAALLKLWLRLLPDPLIPDSL